MDKNLTVCLLRAVNVGGRNKIQMAGLRELLVGLGAGEVRSYIQSGNLVFINPLAGGGAAIDESGLEEAIYKYFGLRVTVILRTRESFRHAIRECPYAEDGERDGRSVYVSFLDSEPAGDGYGRLVDAADGGGGAGAGYALVGKHLYLRSPSNNSEISFSNSALEKILQVRATTRNWNTVTRLDTMITEIDGALC